MAAVNNTKKRLALKISRRTALPHLMFWGAMATIAAMGWFLHDIAVKARTAAAGVVQSHEALQLIGEVDHAAMRAERAHREYLGSATDRFLIERDEAFTAANAAVTRLNALAAADRTQSENARNLQNAIFEVTG